jgi:hypothetical protein
MGMLFISLGSQQWLLSLFDFWAPDDVRLWTLTLTCPLVTKQNRGLLNKSEEHQDTRDNKDE